MVTQQPIESHAVHSARMLEHAAEMIAQGDRVQASEKIWGAAAHRVKQIAAEREWPNISHADGWSIIKHLENHTGNRRVSELFAIANDSHQNHYEDRLMIDELAKRLEDIRTLVELLDEAHRTLPDDLPMPADRHYRQRHAE